MSKATAEHNPNPDPNPHPHPNPNQVLFFPEARGARGAHVARLRAELEAARRTLDVAMFTLTHDGLADALLSQHRRGCRVRVLTPDPDPNPNPNPSPPNPNPNQELGRAASQNAELRATLARVQADNLLRRRQSEDDALLRCEHGILA